MDGIANKHSKTAQEKAKMDSDKSEAVPMNLVLHSANNP